MTRLVTRPPAAGRAFATIVASVLVACGGDTGETGPGVETPALQTPAARIASSDWPDSGPINLRRERRVDLTRNGLAERVTVTARGPAYDALDIDLAIISARGDTVWLEQWPSLHYFKYTPIEELADSAVTDIVQRHIDGLLADDSFTDAGLPSALSHGESRDALREAVTYHLAELDWRAGADLRPADQLPIEAHDRIRVEHIAPDRVDVVIDEVMVGPMFMYHAGGEATYAIGWSVRENAFVRLWSCC